MRPAPGNQLHPEPAQSGPFIPACAQDPAKRHELDRAAVRELECALCGLRQATGLACAGCGVAFGAYACLRCRFFDDDLRKQQFHCDACGICRVGGRANFFHCATCGCCYAATLEARTRARTLTLDTSLFRARVPRLLHLFWGLPLQETWPGAESEHLR